MRNFRSCVYYRTCFNTLIQNVLRFISNFSSFFTAIRWDHIFHIFGTCINILSMFQRPVETIMYTIIAIFIHSLYKVNHYPNHFFFLISSGDELFKSLSSSCRMLKGSVCSVHDLQGQFSFKLRKIVKTRGSSMLLKRGDSSVDVIPWHSSSASNVEVSSLFQTILNKMQCSWVHYNVSFFFFFPNRFLHVYRTRTLFLLVFRNRNEPRLFYFLLCSILFSSRCPWSRYFKKIDVQSLFRNLWQITTVYNYIFFYLICITNMSIPVVGCFKWRDSFIFNLVYRV